MAESVSFNQTSRDVLEGWVIQSTEERKWDAVLERDSSQDGRFVYAVASTGVYCRPSCPSRRPSRHGVTFFPTPEAAEAAGYRACLRCEPQHEVPEARRQIEQAREYLDQHCDETVTLERLGRAAHMIPYHLQRSFKRVF